MMNKDGNVEGLLDESTATLIDLNNSEDKINMGTDSNFTDFKDVRNTNTDTSENIKESEIGELSTTTSFDQVLFSSVSTATSVSAMSGLYDTERPSSSSRKKLTSTLSEPNLLFDFKRKENELLLNKDKEVPGALRILELAKNELKTSQSKESEKEIGNEDMNANETKEKDDVKEKKRRPVSTYSKKPVIKDSAATCELEFDYNQFLDQVRQPQALAIVRYLENFVKEFDKKSWSVRDQVKIISEFTDFVINKMLDNPVWKQLLLPADATEEEYSLYPFDAAYKLIDYLQEGVEQYLMNRIHNRTFQPAGSDDLERDHVLSQRIRYLNWIEEKHLDIPHSDHNRYYLLYAQQELHKLNNFKTPRHKMICLLNCIKYIYGLLRKLDKDPNTSDPSGADRFLPLLIFVVLKANPAKLISNLQYISRFRHPSRLQSESGYYLTNLVGAVSFIETIEPSSLTITKEEFEANIERTLQTLKAETPDSPPTQNSVLPTNSLTTRSTTNLQLHTNSNVPSPELLKQSVSVNSSPMLKTTSNQDMGETGIQQQQFPAQYLLAQKIKRPLDTLGKFFADVTSPLNTTFSSSQNEPPNTTNSNPGSPRNSQLLDNSTRPKDKQDLRKKKSFLNTLFGDSSSSEGSDEDSNYITYPTYSNQNDPITPILPPRRKSSLPQVQEKLIDTDALDTSRLEQALKALEVSEKRGKPLPEQPSQPTNPQTNLPPPAPITQPIPFQDGISQLQDMFPNYEADILQAILTEKQGNLTRSIEVLLEMDTANTVTDATVVNSNLGEEAVKFN